MKWHERDNANKYKLEIINTMFNNVIFIYQQVFIKILLNKL